MKLDRIIAVRNNKTVYRDGEDCIKLFDSDYSKEDVLNEALNQARAESTGLNVPKIKAVTVIDGKWAIVSEYIKGKTIERLIKEQPDKKAEYLSFFVDLQLKVQSETSPLLNKLRDKMRKRIAACELDATTRYDLVAKLERMPKHNKLCHGDFNTSNVVITEEGKAYILDWAHATIGNGSADVAATYLLFKLRESDEFAEEYINLFCEKSGTEKSYVKRWIPLVAAAQSVKCRPNEQEYYLSLANTSEFDNEGE